MNHQVTAKDRQVVMVVHGRDEKLRKELFDFLRAIGLKPKEWSQAVRDTGEGTPYIGTVLDTAMSKAQAVVVLFTPDDLAYLNERFWKRDEPSHEKELTPQARPNVLFEAGMAFGRFPERTILVSVGKLRPFSDIGGRHMIQLRDNQESRHELAQRLETAGCDVDITGKDWLKTGSFKISSKKAKKASNQ